MKSKGSVLDSQLLKRKESGIRIEGLKKRTAETAFFLVLKCNYVMCLSIGCTCRVLVLGIG